MNRLILLILFLTISLGSIGKQVDNSQYVNPFIGNDDNGHTFPGAAMPFGFVQASPETGNCGWRYCSGYNYSDSIILGFAQTHLNGTGCTDLGDVLLLPISGNTEKNSFNSRFSKKTEKAMPGFYTVNLTDFDVDVELTATSHTALHRYTFKKGDAHLLVDLQSGVCWDNNSKETHVLKASNIVEGDTMIIGYHRLSVWVERDLFYVIEFDKPFRHINELALKQSEKGKKYLLDFDIKPGEQLMVKVALSTASIEGAKNNMKVENPGWNFELIRNQANQAWNTLLSKVTIKGSKEQKSAFYTSLYHLFLQPSNIADVDGQYRGANDRIYSSPSKVYYSTLSIWDTYRAAHPLYTILSPDRVDDFISTMISHFEVTGILPIWTLWGKENNCMIGNHSVPVIVDAYLKGFRGFDAEKAYEAIKTSLTTDHYKSSWKVYDQHGYYPFDLFPEESVSRTLECSYDDYAAALLAKALGKDDDYRFFIFRSNYYKNIIDPGTKLARGRDSKGEWHTPFNPFDFNHNGGTGNDFTEGNSWQYTWHVQHDVDGLAELMGGKAKMADKLDSLFILTSTTGDNGAIPDVSGLIGQYAHGNEPSHHVAYLFTLLGRGYRTQELVREIVDKFYLPKPNGLCGNDDCGQMSAWYVFSSMGFYPVDPVSGKYVFGAPQLPEIKITLPGDKQFTIEAKNLSSANKYVKSITLNGKPCTDDFITHKDIMNGGSLVFEMTDKPIMVK